MTQEISLGIFYFFYFLLFLVEGLDKKKIPNRVFLTNILIKILNQLD